MLKRNREKELNKKAQKVKTMKKFLFMASVAAVAMCSLWGNGTSKDMQLSALEKANIEALSGTNDTDKIPPCTGPKVNGNCQCTNDKPCKDLTGCQ